MSWSQITFVVDMDDVDRLSDMLESFLALAVTTENAGDDEFYEVAFPGRPDWSKVRVTGLFDAAVDLDPIVNFVQARFSNSEEVPTSISRLVDQDWERVWLTSFEPIKVGTNLWVCPSWCQPTEPNARNIILDPGLAFGTGTHATTHMCLAWIADQNLTGQTILDYGSGSGILAIAAILAGAEQADAVDIDPLAVRACQENAIRNSVPSKIGCYLPDQLPGPIAASPAPGYDLVIANILAEVIIELQDILLSHLKPGGTLLMTGILTSQAERVKASFGDKLQFIQHEKDQWCLLTASD